MTIQRQYSLPNCKLVLEGLTSDNPLEPTTTARPLVSMITNVECQLSGVGKPLAGGREFLESLVKAVSEYAQDYLSGIPHSVRRDRQDDAGLVQLHQVDKNLHRLSIQPQVAGGDQTHSMPAPIEIDLTTVQLFDLVEAIDQFLADAQTLPELSLNLTPLPKRYILPKEPLTTRAVPAVLGVSSLAAAAVAFFFIPIPEVRRPEEPATSPTPQESPISSPGASSPEGSPSPATTSPSPETAVSPQSTENSPDSPNNTTASPSPGDLETILENSNEILDPAELAQLTGELQSDLYAAWDEKPAPTFTEPLEYQVGVDESGNIVGYNFANDAALNYVEEIPLSDVQFEAPDATEADPGAETSERIAQFLVVFRPEGIIEISPWYGLPPSDPETSPLSNSGATDEETGAASEN